MNELQAAWPITQTDTPTHRQTEQTEYTQSTEHD